MTFDGFAGALLLTLQEVPGPHSGMKSSSHELQGPASKLCSELIHV